MSGPRMHGVVDEHDDPVVTVPRDPRQWTEQRFAGLFDRSLQCTSLGLASGRLRLYVDADPEFSEYAMSGPTASRLHSPASSANIHTVEGNRAAHLVDVGQFDVESLQQLGKEVRSGGYRLRMVRGYDMLLSQSNVSPDNGFCHLSELHLATGRSGLDPASIK